MARACRVVTIVHESRKRFLSRDSNKPKRKLSVSAKFRFSFSRFSGLSPGEKAGVFPSFGLSLAL